jgi:hypothetical protein
MTAIRTLRAGHFSGAESTVARLFVLELSGHRVLSIDRPSRQQQFGTNCRALLVTAAHPDQLEANAGG